MNSVLSTGGLLLLHIFITKSCAGEEQFRLRKYCDSIKAEFDRKCPANVPPVFKIIGGTTAQPEESKFMVRVGYGPKKRLEYRCGGSLIHERWVLTAAHCAINESSTTPSFVQLHSSGRLISIEQVLPHPRFNKKRSYFDVLLLKLKDKVKFDCQVLPVCLSSEPIIAGEYGSKVKYGSILGWGWTALDSGASKYLLTADVQFFGNKRCNQLYSSLANSKNPMIEKGIIGNLQICAGSLSGEQDTCIGDSGGPLVIRTRNSQLRTQVGITSFGYGCGTPSYPGVYARVSHFVPWIESSIKTRG